MEELRFVTDELACLRVDQAPVLARLMPSIRRLLEADALLLGCPIWRGSGWQFGIIEQDNIPAASQFVRRFSSLIESMATRWAWFDPARPERTQRNRVLDALDIIPAGEYEASRVYREVMYPIGLHQSRQPRVLLCEGPSLLAWFGAFHHRPFDHQQLRTMRALMLPMRRRLGLERRIRVEPQLRMMVDAVLEQLGSPAWITDAKGRMFEANASARALFDSRAQEIVAATRDAIAGRQNPLAVELTPISLRGAPPSWLAVLRAGSRDARIGLAVAEAAVRWSLAERRRAVLELVVRGAATATIAACLGVSERAVEQHVTALLARAGVESRAALVSRVLVPDG